MEERSGARTRASRRAGGDRTTQRATHRQVGLPWGHRWGVPLSQADTLRGTGAHTIGAAHRVYEEGETERMGEGERQQRMQLRQWRQQQRQPRQQQQLRQRHEQQQLRRAPRITDKAARSAVVDLLGQQLRWCRKGGDYVAVVPDVVRQAKWDLANLDGSGDGSGAVPAYVRAGLVLDGGVVAAAPALRRQVRRALVARNMQVGHDNWPQPQPRALTMDVEALWQTCSIPLVWPRLLSVVSPLRPEAWVQTHKEYCRQCETYAGEGWTVEDTRLKLDLDPECFGMALAAIAAAGFPIPVHVETGLPMQVALDRGLIPETAYIFKAAVPDHAPGPPCLPAHYRNPAVVKQLGRALAPKLAKELQRGHVVRANGVPARVFPVVPVIKPADAEDARRSGELPPVRKCIGLHRSLNEAMSAQWKVAFVTLMAFIMTIRRGWWLSTDDFESFYRVAAYSRSASKLVGFFLPFGEDGTSSGAGYFYEARVSFGLSVAVPLMCSLSAHFTRVLSERVHCQIGPGCQWSCLVWIDDVCIAAATPELVKRIRKMAYSLADELGMAFKAGKASPVARQNVMLGVLVDTWRGVVAVTNDKRARTVRLISQLLASNMVTAQVLRSCAGRLTWLSGCVPASRVRVRSLWTLLHNVPARTRALRLSRRARRDLLWWMAKLQDWQVAEFLWPSWKSAAVLAVDSSGEDEGGSGAVLLLDNEIRVAHQTWPPWLLRQIRRAGDSSMLRELAGVGWGVRRWRRELSGRSLIVVVDNQSVVHALNSGWSRGKLRTRLLERLVDSLAESGSHYVSVWADRECALVRLCDAFSRPSRDVDGCSAAGC